MSDDELNRIICEACGWTFLKEAVSRSSDPYEGTYDGSVWLRPGQVWEQMETWHQRECYYQEPPDYINGIKALGNMANAEKMLRGYPLKQYHDLVASKCGGYENAITEATARIRAECFVEIWKSK